MAFLNSSFNLLYSKDSRNHFIILSDNISLRYCEDDKFFTYTTTTFYSLDSYKNRGWTVWEW